MNWLNTILVFLVAFVAVFAQAACSGTRNVLATQIDLLPALIVYASLSCSLSTILCLAIFGGLWFDSLSANPLGTTIMPLFLCGYFIYLRRGLILREQLYAQFILGAIASAVSPLLSVLILSCSREIPVLGWGTLWQWIVLTLAGSVLTPVLFKLFDSLNLALNYRPVVESSFRLDRQIRRGRQ